MSNRPEFPVAVGAMGKPALQSGGVDEGIFTLRPALPSGSKQIGRPFSHHRSGNEEMHGLHP